MELPTSPHPTDQTLSDFSLGSLDASSATAVKLHIDGCTKCRVRIAAISDLGVPISGQKAPAIDRPTSGHAQSSATITYNGPSPPEWSNDDAFPSGRAAHPDYEIKRELGRGGMGVVYLVHNKLMGRDAPSQIQIGVDGYRGSYRAEFDRIEIKKSVGVSAGDKPASTAPRRANLLFFDDFDDPRTGWGSTAEPVTPGPITHRYGYHNGFSS